MNSFIGIQNISPSPARILTAAAVQPSNKEGLDNDTGKYAARLEWWLK